MDANCARYFEENFASRGVDVTWGKKTKSAPANITNGDAVVMALAKQYVPINRNGLYEAGKNVDGTINFGGWFSAYLKARKMSKDCGVPFIDAVSKEGMALAGEAVVNDKGISQHVTDLIVSPGLVKGLSVDISSMVVTFEISWHDLPVVDSESKCPSGLGKHHINMTRVCLRRSPEESTIDIATKFLKFALSVSNFTFANIYDVVISGLDPADAKTIYETVLDDVISSKPIYANPLIMLVWGEKHSKTMRYVRDVSDEFLSACQKYVAYVDAQREQGVSVNDALYPAQIGCGRFGSDFLGDYLTGSQITLPGGNASYGATFEETVLNCMNNLSSVVTKVENMSAEEKKKVLFGGDEEEEKNVATDATSSDSKASEDVAGGEEGVIDDEEGVMDDDDTSDVDMALFGSRVEKILKLYDALYSANPRNAFSYKYVAMLPQADSPMVSLYRRRITKGTSDKPWNEEFPFDKIKGSVIFKISDNAYAQFCTASKNIWKGLASSYPSKASADAYALKKSMPKSANDFEWLSSVMVNGEPSVSWFPFIHLALMGHIAPWDITKEGAKTHGWKELRGMLQKWFLAVFRALGDKMNNDETSLDALCEVFMRHFIVAGGNKNFTFSIYWDKRVQMNDTSLGTYFNANEDSSVEMLNEVNSLVTCESSNTLQGVFTGGYTPDLKAYLGDTLLGYDVVLDYLKSHNNTLISTDIPLGQTFRGKTVTLDLSRGGQNVFPAVIRAGARSGKGVLTQLLMITMLGCGFPFVYFDCKPEMSLTWIDWGRKHNVNTLAADIGSDYKQFALVPPSEPINACQYAVMMSSDYIGLLNFVYFGKMVGLLGSLVQARLQRGKEFSDKNLFIFIDEVNRMGERLRGISIPKNPQVGLKYAEAKKTALTLYKKSNKDAVFLPADYDITVQGVGTFTVAQWDAVVGSDGKCTLLNKKLTDLVGAMGKFVGSLSKDAPKAGVFGVLIGQTIAIDLNTLEKSFGVNVGKAFREAGRMALFGRFWDSMEASTDELKARLEKANNSQLTDLTPGIFLYKKEASSGFTAIKTGVVLSENDALEVNLDEDSGEWKGVKKNLSAMLLDNVTKSAGTMAAQTFKEQKLLVTPSMQRILADGGIQAEVGSANPLVTFDGLLEYVANKTGNSPTEPAQALYSEVSKLLTITGSGFTDAYAYLLDPSAIYTEEDFLTALVSGKSMLQGNAESADAENNYFSNVNVDLDDLGETTGNFTAPNTPMPTNPARATAPATSKPADSSFGRGAMPTFESAVARQEEMERAEAERRAEAEGYAGGDGFEDADDFESAGGEATGGESTGGAPDIDYYAGSAEDGGSVVSADEYAGGETPATRTAERRTPAPSVCGTNGASGRYAGGAPTYTDNTDGTVTLTVPGGRVDSYYTAAETVQALSRIYDDDKARKLAQTPKGRALMALESMKALIKMLEDKTGLNRAMIKSVTFADNCLFVRDACVIGGKPDSYDLYDYVDIKNFLKAMSGLTVLRMDRNAYFNLIVRPGCSAQDAFLFSQTLQTFQFDNCQMLRDGRIVGETPDAVKDSFIADFDKVATENAIPTSKSKLFSGAFRERAERESKILHTPEYQEKRARLAKLRRDLYGKKAEQYIEEDRPISGFFSALRFWVLDKKLARLQSQL